MRFPLRVARFVGAAMVVLASLGCAASARAAGRDDATSGDPLESFNRAMFSINEAVDDSVLRPIAKAWVSALPENLRNAVGNAFSNVGDLWTAVNQLLQGKPREAASDLGRFALNTTLGFGGLGDIATELGLEKHREDFGQTLGRWGVGPGFYLVLPFFGPSTLRDAAGLGMDLYADPLRSIHPSGDRNNTYAVRAIDTRAGLLNASGIIEGAALDKYSFIRDGYLQRRRNQIWDGNPPPLPEDSDDQ